MLDLNKVNYDDPSVDKKEIYDTVVDQYWYHPWNQEQKDKGKQVREALVNAALTIIRFVPPSPDRSAALRKLREARMDCNSAITHDGKY